MDSLNDAKFFMLAKQIQEFRKLLSFGYRRLNWKSIGMANALTENYLQRYLGAFSV